MKPGLSKGVVGGNGREVTKEGCCSKRLAQAMISGEIIETIFMSMFLQNEEDRAALSVSGQ